MAALTPGLYHDLGMVPWYRVIMSNSLLVGVITAPSAPEHPISFQNSFGVGAPLAFHWGISAAGREAGACLRMRSDQAICSYYSLVGCYVARFNHGWGRVYYLHPLLQGHPQTKKLGNSAQGSAQLYDSCYFRVIPTYGKGVFDFLSFAMCIVNLLPLPTF